MRDRNRFVTVRGLVGTAVAGAALVAFSALASAHGGAPRPRQGAGPVVVDAEAHRELGRRLFFDPSASSRMGMRSCADCHDPMHGFSDKEVTSLDDTGRTKRHSQTILDGASNPSGHWDGEFDRISALVQSRLNVRFASDGSSHYGNDGFLSSGGSVPVQVVLQEGPSVAPGEPLPVQSGLGVGQGTMFTAEAMDPGSFAMTPSSLVFDAFLSLVRPPRFHTKGFFFSVPQSPDQGTTPTFVNVRTADLVRTSAPARLASSARYAKAFAAAFGDEKPTIARVSSAIEAFCHSVVSGESAYDRFAAGQSDALSASQKHGLELFSGAAGCASCHVLAGDSKKDATGAGPVARAPFTDYAFHNTGIAWRAAVAEAKNAPTDEFVLQRVQSALEREPGRAGRTDRAEDDRAFKTPTLRDVASRGPYMHDGSLRTLEDVVRHYAQVPTENNLDAKFPKSFAPTNDDVRDLVAFLRALSSDVRPGIAPATFAGRVAKTRLEFVDESGAPLGGLRVDLVSAGDRLPDVPADGASEPRVETTLADGTLTFVPGRSTHTRLVLESGGVPKDGDLVPDTCASARIVVPLKGTATLAVEFRHGDAAPDTIVATHPDAPTFPAGKVPTTVFRRFESATFESGSAWVIYEAPARTDVGRAVELSIKRPDGATRLERTSLENGTPTLVSASD